ncbi:endonuclease/exonuclease/phosphatase family protein [Loktanella sp. TSTF-M6]|uniref:Endonuclease/exonuclease/phosphatase family protein n=1 Tax=Loktanella gaetbuli TaxID=2881335 RepID=A0ABS8BTU7_9RHOB|nr:endonuclease/exonuclease/phosphatase family protein [Loktanella gaetbuli]MCB5199159.1 endonuclease/exonuclease/phosphatase family protein [Loktanella gaetbuli]
MATVAQAEPLRIATFAAPLGRDGPGLLLRDLGRDDPQIDAVAAVVLDTDADILLLTDVDHDLDGLTLAALAQRLNYPHRFALAPNTGLPTGLDLDGNGTLGEARDAQGYGRFPGDSGLAVLSRYPIITGEVRDLSAMLWRDLPGATLPEGPLGSADIMAVQRLSSTAHWIVPIAAPDGPVTLMAYSATPPVFDGPEDRNGLRNRDELRLWAHILDHDAPLDFIIIGNANLDPADGAGYRAAMQTFLADPRIIDPAPDSPGGLAAANPDHTGDPALDTADWPDDGPGNLRVSYVLPAATWSVTGAGVVWPTGDDPLAQAVAAAGPHRMVWVDIAR